ncbi:hypothetical protein OE88DRAFT_661993 [Heliocybe sulcata]|uniref:Nucleoporin NSP1-like C-terminal domain-containing protein n=1 Tax=Heliocybe sulcata TaxID=5364 RepID=A0A5C3NEL2_9AGAM|nr:hypothetical protein OE88DRAFT_661993 [Heliocybe sulcata]
MSGGSGNIFGNSGGGGGGLFGGPKPAGSLFGNTGAGTGGGLFGSATGAGGTTNTSTPPAGGGLFGNPPNTATAPAPGGGLFGNTSNTPAALGGGLFGNTTNTTSTTPAAGGGLFGNTNPSTSTSTPSGGLFGGGTSGTNPLLGGSSTTTSAGATGTPAAPSGGLFDAAPKPAGTTDSAPKTSSFFSNPPSATAATSGTSGLPGGSLFGNAAKPAENAASTPAAPATGSLFGGGVLGGANANNSTATPAAATSSTPAAGGGLFGGGNLFGKKPDTPAAGASGTTTSTTAMPSLFGSTDAGKKETPAATTGGLFGNLGGNKPEEKKDAPAGGGLFGPTPATSGEKKDALSAFSLGAPATANTNKEGEKKDVPALTASALGPPAPAIAVAPPSMLRGKTIEDIVSRWSSELETHVRTFNEYAGEVSAWDRALIENGNNLAALFAHVLAAEREQTNIDQALDHIEQQQRDLSATLDVYGKSAEDILGGDGDGLRVLDTGPADSERDKNYMLATELHTHLDDLSSSLTQMIEEVNTVSEATPEKQQGEDPMSQIVQILSSHLESLQWIDGSVRELETKVGEVESRIKESGSGVAAGLNSSSVKPRSFGLNRSAY